MSNDEFLIENVRIDLNRVDEIDTGVTEFGAFNDPEYWEPLFASGELLKSQRFQLDEPLHVGLSLWSVWKFAQLRNEERAEQDKAGKYGLVVLRKRTVTTTRWRDVPYEEIDDARR